MVTACTLLGVAAPALAQQNLSAGDEKIYQDVQRQFAEAYNRQDAVAMAALFTENGVRITPNGIIQGRDAILSDMQNTLKMGLHDYTVRRTVSRSEGNPFSMPGNGKPSWATGSTTVIIRRFSFAKAIKQKSWKRQ
jgi:hypothetical protein